MWGQAQHRGALLLLLLPSLLGLGSGDVEDLAMEGNVPEWLQELILKMDQRLQHQERELPKLSAVVRRLEARLEDAERRGKRASAELSELDGGLANVTSLSTRHEREIGRLVGCVRGRRLAGRCYLLFREYRSHPEALAACRAGGGQLASARDSGTNEALARYAQTAVAGNWLVWIGVTDERLEGVYLHVADGTRAVYAPWHRGPPALQPNGGRAENCVGFTIGDGAWWDSSCDGRHLFMCMYDV
ncbi:C-type lectin domain family 11 member A [Lethenteron reissneri]|uniref:C-type lectin domain family 11 member A n=1 Tax=Lethenteron reissneri TaxID=7753 RepID=UPI002AB69079|nr:C-type lectin domain family 11 member A [Lethenteron reissneri]